MARRAKLVPPAKSGDVSSYCLCRKSGGCTCEFVEFQGESYGEEEQLVGDRYDSSDAHIVVVKDVYDRHVD